MSLIVICEGGGKTTLMQKYPHFFLDIDDFIWSYNTNYHDQLRNAIAVEDMNAISNIYKTIMVNSRQYLQTQGKIILGHDPIYSEWIGVELLVQMKPSIRLHELNIATRTPELKRIALQNWMDLDNAIIYDDWESFNTLIFKNIHTLNLRICRQLTDVSALGNVHTLNLSYCDNITDVSALGNVHTLNLTNCKKITDVSALGKVHNLDLRHCENITDVSALGNVYNLSLRGCENISDVSALGNVHTLKLDHCDKITDVSALKNVHTLSLPYYLNKFRNN